MSSAAELIIPVAAFVVIFILILALSKSKGGKETHYDEMQLKFRAAGYKTGFFVTLAGIMVYIVLSELSDGFNNAVGSTFAMYAVAMAGIVAFAVYCISKDAFYSIGQNKRYYMILCVCVIVTNAVGAAGEIAGGTIPAEGRLTFSNSANFVTMAGFLIILIALAVKNAKDRNEVEE